MEENQKQCPCCENHCSCDALQCGKGRHYFSANEEQNEGNTKERKLEHRHEHKGKHLHYEDKDKDEQLRMLMRRCGHVLWHQSGGKESQKRILSILARHEVMTQKELQEELDIKSGSLSEILGKIENDALIERKPNEQDKRNIDVCLSEAGKQAVELDRQARHEETKEMFASLRDAEKDQLLVILHKLVHAWKVEGRQTHHHKHKKDNV